MPRRKKQPTIWGRSSPRKDVKRRSKQELDTLAEEYIAWKLAILHICVITWVPEEGKAFYEDVIRRGKELYIMTPVQIRKLQEYKNYVKEFHS